MIIKNFVASQCGAVLDSDVHGGGGTDDTAAIQGILDIAQKDGAGVHLIMDGAALITGIKVYSDTVIECPTPSCGFFLADGSDCAIVSNANMTKRHTDGKYSYDDIEDQNISLIGGTYNHNCRGQKHDVPRPEGGCDFTVAFWFVGIRNLLIRDVNIIDQRTFTGLFVNWERVNIDSVHIDLPHKEHYQNQDGFHFFGPGRYLNIHNLSGNAGDDFLAIAPDEADGVSDISDVMIDGIHLEDADQGIRLLVHKNGRLDRVTIKNVDGTYRSFGFFINPFFPDGVTERGGYGDIIFDTVNLHQTEVDYTYTDNFLFRIGGHIDHITLRNIYSISPNDARALIQLGWQAEDDAHVGEHNRTEVGSMLLDGLEVLQNKKDCEKLESMSFMEIKHSNINRLCLRNVNVVRTDDTKGGNLIKLLDGVKIKKLDLFDIDADGLDELVNGQGDIEKINTDNVCID